MRILPVMSEEQISVPTLDVVENSVETQRKRNRVHQRAGSAVLSLVFAVKDVCRAFVEEFAEYEPRDVLQMLRDALK